jgi:membrane protein DedA with SNARE-associated domain
MSIRGELLRGLKAIVVSAVGGLIVGLVALCVGFLFGESYNNVKLITSSVFIFTLLGIILTLSDYLMILWDRIKYRRK